MKRRTITTAVFVLNLFYTIKSSFPKSYLNETQTKHIILHSEINPKSFIGSIVDHSNEVEMKPPFYVVPLEPEDENVFKKFLHIDLERGQIYTNQILNTNYSFAFSALSINTGQAIIVKISVAPNEIKSNYNKSNTSTKTNKYHNNTSDLSQSNVISKPFESKTTKKANVFPENECSVLNNRNIASTKIENISDSISNKNSYKCYLIDAKSNFTSQKEQINNPELEKWTGVILFRCNEEKNYVQVLYTAIYSIEIDGMLKSFNSNIQNYAIYLDKNLTQKVSLNDSSLSFKQLFINVKCRLNTNASLIKLKLFDNEGFFVLSNSYALNNFLAVFIFTKKNESCFLQEFTKEIINKKTKSFDMHHTLVLSATNVEKITEKFTDKSNLKKNLYVNAKLISGSLIAIVFIFTLCLILVFVFYKKITKYNTRKFFTDSSSKTKKNEKNPQWLVPLRNSNFSVNTNTIDTRSSVVSQNGDFLTLQSKHSVKTEHFSDELKVNDNNKAELKIKEEIRDGFFAFSHGYLNEMGISMMDDLLNVAANSKIMNKQNHLSTISTQNNLLNSSSNKCIGRESFLKNDKFVYMDVDFYKWCKLLDWKFSYNDMSDVLQDLIEI
jgi:hypothetical protein